MTKKPTENHRGKKKITTKGRTTIYKHLQTSLRRPEQTIVVLEKKKKDIVDTNVNKSASGVKRANGICNQHSTLLLFFFNLSFTLSCLCYVNVNDRKAAGGCTFSLLRTFCCVTEAGYGSTATSTVLRSRRKNVRPPSTFQRQIGGRK